tara:strand:- start:12992 stop:13687 length:696 start_codon:yes stop_codon:yes gene_type:complete
MKNLFLSVFAFCTTILFAQEYHWTSYNFSVANEDVEVVGKIVGDYFGEEGSKSAGVSVFLFENHFNDNSINYSHSIVFTGSLNAMGAQYDQQPSAKWQLFLTKLNQYTEGHSSGAGRSLVSFGETGKHPIQNLYWMNVENPQKFAAAFKKYNSKFNPSDRRVTLGRFALGASPYGESHYVLVGVDDFKTAMSTWKYRETNKAASAAWKEYRDNRGEVEFIRSTTRVMLGKW